MLSLKLFLLADGSIVLLQTKFGQEKLKSVI